MRSVALAVLAVIGIVVCLRMHLADRLYRLGRDDAPAAAAAQIQDAYEIDPGDALYALRIGRAKLEIGTREDLEEAISWFRMAAQRNPLMARAQYWWGVALVGLQREDEALDRFEVARRLTPYNVDINRRIAGYFMQRWEQTRSRSDLRLAFEAYHALRLVKPEVTTEAVTRLLRHLFVRYEDLDSVIPRAAAERETLAETLANAKRFTWAIRAFDEADDLADAGGRLKVRGRLLYYAHLAEDYPVAALEVIEDVRAFALAEKGAVFAHERELATASLRVGADDGVEARVRAASDDKAIAALKRHVQGASGDLDRAIGEIAAVFRSVSREDMHTLELQFWRWLRERHRTFDAAAADLHLAAASLADSAGAGSVEEALDALKRYERLNPSSARASYLHALCYKRCGRIDLARKRLQKALKLRPDSEEYRRLADELDEEEEK
jgi:tetratricopeptide (TPR) repeat protein